MILEEAHNLLKSQEGIDWRQGKLMILGESTGVYIPEEEAGPCDWGCPCDGDSHADGPVSMGNRMAQVVTCCNPLLPSTPPGLRLCMTSYPSQPQSRLHYSTHVMCHSSHDTCHMTNLQRLVDYSTYNTNSINRRLSCLHNFTIDLSCTGDKIGSKPRKAQVLISVNMKKTNFPKELYILWNF